MRGILRVGSSQREHLVCVQHPYVVWDSEKQRNSSWFSFDKEPLASTKRSLSPLAIATFLIGEVEKRAWWVLVKISVFGREWMWLVYSKIQMKTARVIRQVNWVFDQVKLSTSEWDNFRYQRDCGKRIVLHPSYHHQMFGATRCLLSSPEVRCNQMSGVIESSDSPCQWLQSLTPM